MSIDSPRKKPSTPRPASPSGMVGKNICPEPCYDSPLILPSDFSLKGKDGLKSDCESVKDKWESIVNCKWRKQFDCPHLKNNEEFIRDTINLIDRLSRII